jgi:tetratricopeptide (TPR) repeat protein
VLDRQIATLVRKELIRPATGLFAGEEAYRFGHLLIRDAAYESLAKAARADLHARFADWLAEASADRAAEFDEIIGHHLESAYRYRHELTPADKGLAALARRASDRLAPAGHRAFRRGDMGAAAKLLGRASGLLPASNRDRLELLPELGYALVITGAFSQAGEVFAEAIPGATTIGDEGLLARARMHELHLGFYADPDFSAPEMGRICGELIPVLKRSGSDSELALAWIGLAVSKEDDLRYADELDDIASGLDDAQGATDASIRASMVLFAGNALIGGATPVHEGIEYLHAMAASVAAPRAGPLEPPSLLKLAQLISLTRLNGMRGDFEVALRQGEEWIALAEELGMGGFFAAMNSWGLMMVELYVGDLAAAERRLRASCATLERLGERRYLPAHTGFLARVLYEQARYDEAAELAGVCAETARPEIRGHQVEARTITARLLARKGDGEQAEALAREALALLGGRQAPELEADTLLALAEVVDLGGRPDKARPLVEDALRLYERKGIVPSAARARSLLATYEAAAVSRRA